MSYLIDSSVIIDALSPASDWHQSAQALIMDCGAKGRMYVCPVIWSEIAPAARDAEHLAGFCGDLLIERQLIGWKAAWLAGIVHARYRRAGGKREQTLPDFLIAAHAQTAGHQLVTRDPSRYRRFFPQLPIVEPA